MTCEDVLDRLPDWVAGRLDEVDARAVSAHASGCARCAAEADVLRALLAARPAAPADLASRIARAAREGPVAPARRRWRVAPAWVLSAAAVLALAVGTTVLRQRAEPVGPALGEVALPEDDGVLLVDDALVAGAPLLDQLSDDDLAALLVEMGG